MTRNNDTTRDVTFNMLSEADRQKLIGGVKSGATRRDMLRWMGFSGIGLLAGQAILLSATKALADTPVRGGAFRVAMHSSGSTETLDPSKQAYSVDYARARNIYSSLTRLNGAGEAMPELAESVEPSNGGLEWIFKLKRGVEFHDGKTLTSADVVFSLMRHKDPATASAAKVLADQMESITADGPKTVRIKLTAPNADLPMIVATTQFMILQDGTTDFSIPVGTGPYKLSEAFVPQSRMIGKRFGNYFKNGQPYFDEIHVLSISDRNARANALLSGDVDAVTYISPSAVDQISEQAGLKVLRTPSGTFSEIVMMCDRAPTDNNDFRMAMKLLLDRERFLKTVQKGYGQIGNDHVVPPSHPYYNSDLPQRVVDIEKAQYHLKKAGLEGGRAEISVSDAAPGAIEMAQITQQTAARAGLTLDIKREPADGYWSNVWMKKPFIGGRWQARPTLDMLLSLGWISGAKWNDTALANPTLDKLVVDARGELDQAKRKQMYGEVQKILYDEGGNGVFAFLDYIDGMSSKVMGVVPNPVAEMGAYYFDDAWFAA